MKLFKTDKVTFFYKYGVEMLKGFATSQRNRRAYSQQRFEVTSYRHVIYGFN